MNTDQESDIQPLKEFRDHFMIPERTYGAAWAAYYNVHGPRIVQGFTNDPSQVPVYRHLIRQNVPALKAKLYKEIGLSFLSDEVALSETISEENITEAKMFLEKIGKANPAFAPQVDKLLAIADQVHGMNMEQAIEHVLAINPDSL